MQKNSIIFITLSLCVSILFSNLVFAGDIEWSGIYRFEGNALKNSELGGYPEGRGKDKSLNYGLNHLVLRPKIVAGDGLFINGQFDIFNDSTRYPNSQMGQVWGSGVRTGALPTTSSQDSNSTSETQKAETIEVTQLYLTLTQEYGSLLLGRAPLHFGLGMTHNAGRGLFDHWYDTRDLVAYKFVIGNLYLMPMFGKPVEGEINQSDDVNDYMIQAQYENPETDIEMGVFYMMRRGGEQASDAPIKQPTNTNDGVIGGANATNDAEVDSKLVSIYALRDSERFRIGFEASFQSGETGVRMAPSGGNSGEKVTWGGYGIAAELEFRPEASSWNWELKAGTASGDDPASPNKFEGFIFDRNYDVAMLMFNHPLGMGDFFRTRLVTGSVRDTDENINRADVEAISNVSYVAPTARYKISDRWALNNTLITGWLGTQPFVNQTVNKQLGYEWDISVNFTPRKGIMWMNQFGILFPGDAWAGDSNSTTYKFNNDMTYGFATKAAISF